MKPSRVLPVAALLLVGVVLAAVLPGLGGHHIGPGEALVTVHGRIRVTRAAGATEIVSDHTRLEPGDGMAELSGTADLELAAGVRYAARAAGDGQRATRLLMGKVPVLQAGRLLVTATDGAQLTAAGTTVALPGRGAIRVVRSLATQVGVYEGLAQLDSAGATGAVGTLRSVDVPALGQVPRERRPLAYSAADPWDRQFLGEAIAVDSELRSIMAGFRAAGGDADAAAQAVRAGLSDPPSASALAARLRTRRDDDGKLVGTAIAGLGRGATFADRWRAVFSFRDDGAPWGLVALDRGVGADELGAAIARALDNTQFAFASTGGRQLAGGPLSGGAPGLGGGGTGPGGVGPGTGPGTGPGGSTPGGGGPVPTILPPVTLPGGPPATTPPITIPGGPPVTIPPVTIPGGPPVTIPPVTIPPATIPPVTIPPVTIPPVTIPPVTIPHVTIPPVTIPHVTIPPVTIPHVTIPPVTIPPVTIPPVTLPPLSRDPVPLGALDLALVHFF